MIQSSELDTVVGKGAGSSRSRGEESYPCSELSSELLYRTVEREQLALYG